LEKRDKEIQELKRLIMLFANSKPVKYKARLIFQDGSEKEVLIES
jgi:hypothetical protein